MATGTGEGLAPPAQSSKRRSGRLAPKSCARHLIFLRRDALADDQKLRGGRRRDHRRIFGFEARNSNRADESSELNLREGRRTHLGQEPRPFRRRADEADIAEALDPQRLGDDFEIKCVRMRHHDQERAVGRAGEFGRRFWRMNERHVRGRVRRKSVAPGIDPAHSERQRRERERQRPSDVTGAKQIDRARQNAEQFGPARFR